MSRSSLPPGARPAFSDNESSESPGYFPHYQRSFSNSPATTPLMSNAQDDGDDERPLSYYSNKNARNSTASNLTGHFSQTKGAQRQSQRPQSTASTMVPQLPSQPSSNDWTHSVVSPRYERNSYSSAKDFKRAYEAQVYHADRTPSTPSNMNSSSTPLMERPVLGHDWDTEEERAPPVDEKVLKRKQKWNSRRNKCFGLFYSRNAVGSDENGDHAAGEKTNRSAEYIRLCGLRARTFLIIFGLFIVALVVVLAICIPRKPDLKYNMDTPLEERTGSGVTDPNFVRSPSINFTFDANVNLALDTSSSFVPLHFKKFDIAVHDVPSGHLVGSQASNAPKITAPGKESTYAFQYPITFSYKSTSGATVATDDDVWDRWYKSCEHKWPGYEDRPGLNFTLDVTMDIIGMVSKVTQSTTFTNVECPIELPTNQ